VSVSGDRPRHFFGRRKGKQLRKGQAHLFEALLPALRVDVAAPIADPAALFPQAVRETRLEIGFGGGEHLLKRAREHPDIGFIGCEPFVNGMAKMLGVIEAERLANIRLFDDDAMRLIGALPPASLAMAYLLYPDPWPKRRQRKRRFVSGESLAALARAIRPGGALHFATDIDDYAGWTLARVLASPDWRWEAMAAADWMMPFDGWVRTRYEAKAVREGRATSYLIFVRAAP
jgi:tRNA (guanine-N7-)-methyltransferase